MKRTILSLALIFVAIFVYRGWFDIDLPETANDLNNDLDQHAIAYDVINGTPLILARFGDVTFLDTIQLERFSMNVPPTPRWQWTGNWERVNDPTALATVDLSAEFGPTVLFGLVNDDSVVTLQVVREGEVIQEFFVGKSGFILPAEDVRLTDTVKFLDEDGEVLVTKSLM